MTKPIIVVKVPCKLLYVIQLKEFLIKCSTSWPYLISEFLVAYITIVASDWPRTFFTPKVFLFSINVICSHLNFFEFSSPFTRIWLNKNVTMYIRMYLYTPFSLNLVTKVRTLEHVHNSSITEHYVIVIAM